MSKITIMLCCAAGMSTSLLVTRMRKAAEEKNIDADIFAEPASEADTELDTKTIDVVLLGPQVRYMEPSFKEKLAGKKNSFDKDIALAVIDMQAYGMMDGAKVLDQAEKIVNR